jgi:hypothetical protein
MLTQEHTDSQDLLEKYWSDCYRYPKSIQTHQAVKNLLKGFRKTLDSSSKTAAAIDMNDSLNEIIRCAEKEGFMEIAQLLSI